MLILFVYNNIISKKIERLLNYYYYKKKKNNILHNERTHTAAINNKLKDGIYCEKGHNIKYG